MPYLLPIAAGLCFNAFAMIPAAFGVIIFYIIKTASEYETALTTKSVNDSMQQISYIVESLFNNKEMILFVIAMVVTITAVYAVRRLMRGPMPLRQGLWYSLSYCLQEF